MQQFEVPGQIKASGSYGRVSELSYFSAAAQAKDVELVKKVPPNPFTRIFQPPKQYFVRKRYRLGARGQATGRATKYLWSEYEILSNLRHPNIVQYVDFEYIPRKNTASIYMEYCDGGDLSQYTANDHGSAKISERQFWEIFHQLASAVLYCHTGLRIDDGKVTLDIGWKKPILHRDIKPANGMRSGCSESSCQLAKYGVSSNILYREWVYPRQALRFRSRQVSVLHIFGFLGWDTGIYSTCELVGRTSAIFTPVY